MASSPSTPDNAGTWHCSAPLRWKLTLREATGELSGSEPSDELASFSKNERWQRRRPRSYKSLAPYEGFIGGKASCGTRDLSQPNYPTMSIEERTDASNLPRAECPVP